MSKTGVPTPPVRSSVPMHAADTCYLPKVNKEQAEHSSPEYVHCPVWRHLGRSVQLSKHNCPVLFQMSSSSLQTSVGPKEKQETHSPLERWLESKWDSLDY